VAHARGKSLRELAKAAKVDKNSLLQYIDGVAKPRDESAWTRIEAVYNEWVRDLSDPKFMIGPPSARLPILETVSPTEWNTAIFSDFLEVPLFLAKNRRLVIRMDDDALAPNYLKSEFLIFELDDLPRSGRTSIASRKGDDVVSIGAIQRDRTVGGTTFVPFSDPLAASPLWVPVGYLVAVCRDWQITRGIIEFDDGGLTL
jgi:hypothetical protein